MNEQTNDDAVMDEPELPPVPLPAPEPDVEPPLGGTLFEHLDEDDRNQPSKPNLH